MTYFVRVGPSGFAYGPFESRRRAIEWLETNGFDSGHEGASFKVYEAHDPDLYQAHVAMLGQGAA